MLSSRSEPEVTDCCTEAFVLLSLNRKNQREIAYSGVAAHFPKILGGANVSSVSRAYCLLMIGNLLSAGFFRDKMGHPDTVTTILNMLDPSVPRQFVAVAYCLSQIAGTQAVAVIVQCGAIQRMTLLLNVVEETQKKIRGNPFLYETLEETSPLAVLKEGLAYVWGLLTNLLNIPEYYRFAHDYSFYDCLQVIIV